MYSIRTLGDLRRHGWILYAACNGRFCGRGQRLNLDALIARFGADHSVIGDRRIAARLRCSACGARDAGLRLSPPVKTGPLRRPPGRAG